MNDSRPHYLLKIEANREGKGFWRFVLRQADGTLVTEVADVEPGVWGDRLDLLTVVRALEALDEPSRVTLSGCTRYVEQGIQYGLTEWRENDWRWEFFGQMVPVRDVDLWQRMDRIVKIHRVDCVRRRFDAGHPTARGSHWDRRLEPKGHVGTPAPTRRIQYHAPTMAACFSALNAASQFFHNASKAPRQIAHLASLWTGVRPAWSGPVKFRGLAAQH